MSNTTAAATPTISEGDTAWVLVSTCLVYLMIPGVGYFYSGMSQSKNALSLIFLSLLSVAIVSIEWFAVGFSLSFSETGNFFIGDFKNAFFIGIDGTVAHPVAPTIPNNIFAAFQGMFAAITPALAFGGAAERSRILPCLVFLLLWSLLVYNFIAYWTWGPNGWMRQLGVLDYAGGTPVHIASGMAGLAYVVKLGKRSGYGIDEFRPHSYFNIMLGTALLWFGWFGFNAGSAGGANAQAANAVITTNLSASVSGVTWILWAWWRHEKKWSSFHFCSGAVAGLVAITPASGFVKPWAALIIGVVAGSVCHFAVELKHRMGYDDAVDIFAVHAVGGIIGCALTGVFAGETWMQLPIQLAGLTAGAVWSFTITWLLLFLMDSVLQLRLDEAQEIMGMDASEMGEAEYEHVKKQLFTANSNSTVVI